MTSTSSSWSSNQQKDDEERRRQDGLKRFEQFLAGIQALEQQLARHAELQERLLDMLQRLGDLVHDGLIPTIQEAIDARDDQSELLAKVLRLLR